MPTALHFKSIDMTIFLEGALNPSREGASFFYDAVLINFLYRSFWRHFFMTLSSFFHDAEQPEAKIRIFFSNLYILFSIFVIIGVFF